MSKTTPQNPTATPTAAVATPSPSSIEIEAAMTSVLQNIGLEAYLDRISDLIRSKYIITEGFDDPDPVTVVPSIKASLWAILCSTGIFEPLVTQAAVARATSLPRGTYKAYAKAGVFMTKRSYAVINLSQEQIKDARGIDTSLLRHLDLTADKLVDIAKIFNELTPIIKPGRDLRSVRFMMNNLTLKIASDLLEVCSPLWRFS